MTRETSLSFLGLLPVLFVLTFTIPGMQWLCFKLRGHSQYNGLIVSVPIAFFIFFWNRKLEAFPFFPSSYIWRILCYCSVVVVFSLLVVNIFRHPTSKITGQDRLPFEVLSVVILFPAVEELVFGGEHIGFWMQSHWPLPPDALMSQTA